MKIPKPLPTKACDYIGTVSRYREINQTRICCIPGCNRKRINITPYCLEHRRAWDHYGHPLARPIRPADLQPYQKEVKELLHLNPNHPGFEFTRKFFKTKHQVASNPATSVLTLVPEFWSMVYLARTPAQILEIGGALTLMRDRDEMGRVILCDAHFFTTLTRLLRYQIRCTKFGLKVRGQGYPLRHKKLGKEIWDGLGLLFTNISVHAQRRADAIIESKMCQGEPFVISQPAKK